MNWLDPATCHAARSLLHRGNPQRAAALLLNSRWQKHKAVRHLLEECQQNLIEDARQLFGDGFPSAARNRLAEAERCGPLTSEGLRLRELCEQGIAVETTVIGKPDDEEQPRQGEKASAGIVPSRFALGNLAVGKEVMVLTGDLIQLGLAGKHRVEIPIAGPLHRQHAIFIRHGQTVWLSSLPHHQDLVTINGEKLGIGRPLQNGDELALGSARGGMLCRFRFQQAPGSGTATLAAYEHPALLADGRTFERIVLMDDQLAVRQDAAADLRIPEMPCEEFVIRRSECGLTASVSGGMLFVSSGDDYVEVPAPLRFPCKLVIEPPFDMADRLVQAALEGAAKTALAVHLRELP